MCGNWNGIFDAKNMCNISIGNKKTILCCAFNSHCTCFFFSLSCDRSECCQLVALALFIEYIPPIKMTANFIFFFFRLLNLFIFRCIICIKWTRVRSRAVLQMCELAIARSALAHAHRHIETKLNTNDEEIWYAQTSWRIIWNAWCVRRSQSIANKIVTLIEQYGNHLIQL